MKKIITAILFLTAFAFPSSLLNAAVTAISGSGPGGFVYNQAPSGTTAFLSTNFTASNYIDIHVQIDSAGLYQLYQAPSSWGSTNATGTDTWYGMQFDNLNPSVGNFQLNGPFLNFSDNSNKLTLTSFSTTQVIFGLGPNGPVLPANSFSPIAYFQATGPGEIIMRQTPITAIPEPATIFGSVAGLVFLGVTAKRRRFA
jgi:hypothetical protein